MIGRPGDLVIGTERLLCRRVLPVAYIAVTHYPIKALAAHHDLRGYDKPNSDSRLSAFIRGKSLLLLNAAVLAVGSPKTNVLRFLAGRSGSPPPELPYPLGH
jgi:hypothetical protein